MTRLGPLLSPLLIGRDPILELAGRRLPESAKGRGQFLLLSGEAGIGKTRLLAAIRRLASEQGFRVADGALAPQDRDVAAALFLDLARTLARLPAFGGLGNELLGLVTALVDAERPERRLLVGRTVDLIAGSVTKPTMLVFEDLQWADDVSLEILAELAREARALRLLLAGAYRSDDAQAGWGLRDWRSRLVTQRLAEEARLDRLTLEQTGLMTTLIMDNGLPAPRDVVAAVFERTDGVPLHVEELLGALGPEVLVDGRKIREAQVPDSLEDAILLRVRRLSAEAQAVARAGAVIGRCFVPEVLAGIMDAPLESMDGPLQELIDHNFLDPPGLRGLYDYRHQLLRDALYRDVPAATRRRLHARAAEFGATLEGASEIHASVHYERAGMQLQAFRAALSGARSAARLSSHREAFELYRRAVDNLPNELPAAERAAILSEYSDEASAVEENELSERLASLARELYLEAGDGVGAAGMLANIAVCWRREGRPLPDRMAIAQQALDELDAQPPSQVPDEWRVGAYTVLGWTCMDGFELERARQLIGKSLEIAVAAGLVADANQASAGLGMLNVLEGRVDEGLTAIRKAADEARSLGFEAAAVTAYRDAALMAVRSIDYQEAAIRMGDARRYADAIEQSHCARVMASTDSMLAWAGGDWDQAKRIGEQALADHGHGRAAAIARWALGYIALGRGETESAAAHLHSAVEFGQRAEWLEMTLPAYWGLAENALVADDHEAAIGQCEAALGAALARGEQELLVPFVVTGTRAYLASGRPEAAENWYRRVTDAIGPGSSVATPALDHGRGLLRLAAGSITPARQAFEAAIIGWDRRGRLWEALWARLDLARALLRSNRHVEALRLVSEVTARTLHLNSPPLLARAGELERLARSRGSEQAAWHPLTVREFEVARQIAAGNTNSEIADALLVSRKTVSAHVEHILAKLGVSRRAEVAAWVASLAAADRTRHPGRETADTIH